VHVSAANVRYLETKVHRGKHTLDLPLPSVIMGPGAAAVP
jgi:hypothetical protein